MEDSDGFSWMWLINFTPTFYPSVEWITNLGDTVVDNNGNNIVFNPG